MPLLFIATVGGSPQPVIHSLRKTGGERRILFVVSRASASSVETIAAEAELDRSTYELVEVADAQNLNGCVETLQRELAPEAAKWLSRGEGYTIQADITGGTKPMSAGLALVCRRWPCVVTYVGGEERTKGGTGIVLDGREVMVTGPAPSLALGLAAAEEAVGLTEAGEWAAAALVLGRAARVVEDPAGKRGLHSLGALVDAFGLWDRFAHEPAARRLEDAVKNRRDLGLYLTPGSVKELERGLGGYRGRLAALAVERPERRALVVDLFGNAWRRMEEGRYDDAVARSYRLVEAIAQYRLEELGVSNTGRPEAEALPEAVRHLAGRPLGLQNAYTVLEAFGDEAGAAFRRLGLDVDEEKKSHSPLTARNSSILAHGWAPVGRAVAVQLFEKARELGRAVGMEEGEWVQFPRLVALERGI